MAVATPGKTRKPKAERARTRPRRAYLPAAERRKSIEWVGAAEPADVAGSVAAKRALWSELKRLARALSNPGG